MINDENDKLHVHGENNMAMQPSK